MRTFFLATLDFLGGALYLNPLAFEVFYTIAEIFLGTRQFQHHNSLFSGKDGGIEYIKSQIKIFSQVANNRFVNFCVGETKLQYF